MKDGVVYKNELKGMSYWRNTNSKFQQLNKLENRRKDNRWLELLDFDIFGLFGILGFDNLEFINCYMNASYSQLLQTFHQWCITGILIVLYQKNTSMKLAGALIKSGLTVAGAGIFLFFKKLFKKKKKPKTTTAKAVKSKQTKSVRKRVAKPRQKKTAVPTMMV